MSVFSEWPGAGPTPEPEPEGFRDEQTEAEKQRQIDVAKETLERSKETKDAISGKPPEPPPVEGRSTKSHDTKTDTKATHRS